ncbi:MAG: 4-hydroxybenzoate octaprenyltransferase [Wenzhouxiangellaceae bacterium]
MSAHIFSQRLDPWWRLMRFDRPIGIFLLLWPTWWALWLAAGGLPSLDNLLIFTIGVVLMRAAGCVINDYADRDFDPKVERTRSRPLAAGEIAPRQALALFFGLMLSAFALVLLTNTLTVQLSFIGAALAASYPFFKRWTHWPQVVLGMAFGWSIPMAFTAETGSLPNVSWWLFAVNVLWSVIYDTQYAMVDRDDDLRAGVKSTAILFGRYDRLVIAILQLFMLALLLMLGRLAALGWPWLLALVATAGLFGYHQWLIRKRQKTPCFRAFLHNNWVGAVLFCGLWASLAMK